MLRELDDQTDERLLVGPRTFDDAGVVVLGTGEGLPAGTRVALVQTVDFFPPVVDDPFAYGAIAAANALSDVYAMGGKPVSALTLAGFPKGFPEDWRAEILRGGFAKIRESGAVVAGGHTVESEVLFGFAVTGVVDPSRIATNAGARAGDVAYLTKPLGMGAMTTAAKKGKVSQEALAPAAAQMATLNAAAAEAMAAVDAHACTDITGYGMVGHAHNIARASHATFRLDAPSLPLFPGALELARRKLLSGGSARNRDALSDRVRVEPGVDPELLALVHDSETSGGLLIVIAPEDGPALERALRERSVPVHRVGKFTEWSGAAVVITPGDGGAAV